MDKKIAFFIPSFNGGGAEKTMIFLSNSFANRGYKVELLTLNSKGVYKKLVQPNVAVINLSKSRIIKSIPSLILYFRKNNPDVFITAMTHVNIASIISKLLSGIGKKCKMIISVHSITSNSIKNKVEKYKLDLIIKLLYPLAQEIICISNSVAKDLVENFSLDKESLTVINNPVIYPDIYEKAREEIVIEKQSEQVLILSVGRLEKVKNFPVLIKAANILIQKKHPIKLIILGEGSQREELELLIENLGLESYVHLSGFKDNVYPYYKKADLFVLPSKKEGLGNVLIEAMAFNLPVIAAENSGGPEDILHHGKLGKLFNNDDYIDLASKIEDSIAELNNVKVNHDVERYTLETVTDKYERLIIKGNTCDDKTYY